jgi:hypothetical protein
MARHLVLSSRRVPRVQPSRETPGGTSPIWPTFFSEVPRKLLGGHYSPNSVVEVVFSESSFLKEELPLYSYIHRIA